MKAMDTVRVVISNNDILPEWVEIFQYFGVFRVLNEGDLTRTLEFQCPANITGNIHRFHWAEVVSQRMEEMGINAVTSFPWPEENHNHTSDAAAYACGCYE